MQIVVIGCGKVGSSLARELVEAGNEVVIIESDRNLLTNADDIDCMKINGVPIDKDVLKSAGIETADAVCAVTQDDNLNIMCSQVAREIFKVERVIARIFNPGSRELFEEFGLETICSTSLTVDAIIRTLSDEEDEEFHMMCGNDMVMTTVETGSVHVGMTVEEYSEINGKHVLGIIRKTRRMLAMPGMKIEKSDRIILAALQ
jgi:trk system potassium uptake protein TrkA